MAEFQEVCRVADIADARAVGVNLEGLGIAIFRDGHRFHALLDRCPHQNTPMSGGWIEEGEAICPNHQWRFRLTTGHCTTARGNSIHKFPCEVRDGSVWVKA